MNKRKFGQHYTPSEITLKYKDLLIEKFNKGMSIVDPFVGDGNLIIDFLSFFTKDEAIEIIKNKRVRGYDIDYKIILNLKERLKYIYEVEDLYLDEIFFKNNSLKKNVCKKNDFILTNPPYLARNTCKNQFKKDYKKNFKTNQYSDYYEIAFMLYLKNEGVWIIPSNFLSSDIMKNLRSKLIKKFNISDIYLYETPKFNTTNISVMSILLRNKIETQNEIEVNFISKKDMITKKIDIDKDGVICNKWSKLTEFESKVVSMGFLRENIVSGSISVKVINEVYEEEDILISDEQNQLFKENILFLRATDTGTKIGMIGLYTIDEIFNNTSAISLLTKKTSRLYMPIYFKESKTIEEQLLIKYKFNKILNQYRKDYNSLFLTNFKNTTNLMPRKRISFKEVYGIIEKIIN